MGPIIKPPSQDQASLTAANSKPLFKWTNFKNTSTSEAGTNLLNGLDSALPAAPALTVISEPKTELANTSTNNTNLLLDIANKGPILSPLSRHHFDDNASLTINADSHEALAFAGNSGAESEPFAVNLEATAAVVTGVISNGHHAKEPSATTSTTTANTPGVIKMPIGAERQSQKMAAAASAITPPLPPPTPIQIGTGGFDEQQLSSKVPTPPIMASNNSNFMLSANAAFPARPSSTSCIQQANIKTASNPLSSSMGLSSLMMMNAAASAAAANQQLNGSLGKRFGSGSLTSHGEQALGRSTPSPLHQHMQQHVQQQQQQQQFLNGPTNNNNGESNICSRGS